VGGGSILNSRCRKRASSLSKALRLFTASALPTPTNNIKRINQTAPVIHHEREKGVTLIEILVVIAIVGFVVVIFTPSFLRMMNNYRVSTSTSQLAVEIRFARNASIKKRFEYQMEIRNESHATAPNTYTITSDQGTKEFSIDRFAKIDAADTTLSTIIFGSRGSATAGIIVLESKANSETRYQITVTPAGGVRVDRLF
jgi:prepilin-type N-terminal cleavage/methylation domain-containing protein